MKSLALTHKKNGLRSVTSLMIAAFVAEAMVRSHKITLSRLQIRCPLTTSPTSSHCASPAIARRETAIRLTIETLHFVELDKPYCLLIDISIADVVGNVDYV